MLIKLIPCRTDDFTLTLTKEGDSLIVNGECYDFSQIENGDVLPAGAAKGEYFRWDITRDNGQLIIPINFPLPANYSYAQAFPAPIEAVVEGAVRLPLPLVGELVPESLPEPKSEI